MKLTVIFALGMLVSAIVGRVTTLVLRSGIQRRLNGLNALRDGLGIIAGLSFWALIVWGFATLDWYVALPIILVSAFIGGTLANPPRFELFYRTEPIFDFATLGITGWLWFVHWPF